jgi:hypothetical protein
MSFWGWGPTELRILLAIGNGVAWTRPDVTILGREVLLFDAGGAVGAAGLALTLIYSAVSNTRRLSRLEPRPAASR